MFTNRNHTVLWLFESKNLIFTTSNHINTIKDKLYIFCCIIWLLVCILEYRRKSFKIWWLLLGISPWQVLQPVYIPAAVHEFQIINILVMLLVGYPSVTRGYPFGIYSKAPFGKCLPLAAHFPHYPSYAIRINFSRPSSPLFSFMIVYFRS